MSETRRKLLCAPLENPYWTEIARFTTIESNKSHVLPISSYSKLGFFVVGGGGSGHGDYSAAGWSGNGGNGGCVNYWEVPISGNLCTITIGSGGSQSASRSDSKNGQLSKINYNGLDYISSGGYGGNNTRNLINPNQINSGLGGKAVFTAYSPRLNRLQLNEFTAWVTTHTANETAVVAEHTVIGAKGEDGIANPFDPLDLNKYGAGGGGAISVYSVLEILDYAPGGETQGGTGGYGSDNSSKNRGTGATFYGAGGGGGSFSSGHRYSQGGAGYLGIIIVYAK